MLSFVTVNQNSPYLSEISSLYLTAFPKNERRPLNTLINDRSGAGELLAVLDDGVFIGLSALLTWQDITHILYLAVKDEFRAHGYGSQILALIHNRYPGHRIIADVEIPKEGTKNNPQRKKRIAFYQRNGYEFTDIRYSWEDEDYMILSAGGAINNQEFDSFWDFFYKKDAGYDY